MKQDYKHYLPLTEEEMDEVWENCYIVPDTNILLGLYVYSEELREATFDILYKLKENGKLWIPHQVKIEFARNRLAKMKEPYRNIKELINVLKQSKSDFNGIKYGENLLGKKSHNPFINLVDIRESIKTLRDSYIDGVDKIINELVKTKEEITEPKFAIDKILERIQQLFDAYEDDGFDPNDIEKICKEAEKRYKNNIPPGYKDNDKTGRRKFGDFYIWKQMINKVNSDEDSNRKHMLFISDDNKEDWWEIESGYNLWARPELRKEFFTGTTKEFVILPFNKFIDNVEQKLNINIDNKPKLVNEAKEYTDNESKENKEISISSISPVKSLIDKWNIQELINEDNCESKFLIIISSSKKIERIIQYFTSDFEKVDILLPIYLGLHKKAFPKFLSRRDMIEQLSSYVLESIPEEKFNQFSYTEVSTITKVLVINHCIMQ